jgi:hypothetical protein
VETALEGGVYVVRRLSLAEVGRRVLRALLRRIGRLTLEATCRRWSWQREIRSNPVSEVGPSALVPELHGSHMTEVAAVVRSRHSHLKGVCGAKIAQMKPVSLRGRAVVWLVLHLFEDFNFFGRSLDDDNGPEGGKDGTCARF